MRFPSVAADTFADRLGLALPIVQAPMAGSQSTALAAAVGEAGALGALPGAALTTEALHDAVAVLRTHGERPLNLNFFCHAPPAPDPAREAAWRRALAPFHAEHRIDLAAVPTGPGRLPFDVAALAAVEALRPAVVSFHFGLPAPALLARVRASGAQVWSTATTLAEARWLAARGVDAVIAQGLEAGGHRGTFLDGEGGFGQTSTAVLLREVLAEVPVPVIAAGGIVDAADVAAALRLGAAAVQCGTAFLETPEATTSAVHRAALRTRSGLGERARREGRSVDNDAERLAVPPVDTVLTNLFTGRPARGLVNRLIREFGPISTLPPAFPGAVAALAPLRAAAERVGSGDFSPLWAGALPSPHGDRPAAQVVRSLAAAL